MTKTSYLSFERKNKKLKNLITSKKQVDIKNCSVPTINISKYVLPNKEEQQLKFGLKHSFVGRNKNKKRLLSASLEGIKERVQNYSDHDQEFS